MHWRRCLQADALRPQLTCGAIMLAGREQKHLIEVHGLVLGDFEELEDEE